MGKRGENFGNIASISQTHLFHNLYNHISLSTHFWWHWVALYWFVTIVWSFKLHFWKCFKTKKAKKWPNWFGKIEPVYPATTFHKIYIDISLCMGYPAGELFVLGWGLRLKSSFMPFINSFREHLKVQKFTD